MGRFMGDEMGLGKIVEMIAYQTLTYQIYIALTKVKNDWKTNNATRHLISGSEGQKCPMDRFNFQCPCEKDSIASKFTKLSGPTLIIPPLNVVRNFKREWEKFVNMNNEEFALKLMLNYANDKFDNETWVSLKGNFLPTFTGSSIYLDEHKQACMLG
jgi:SNF2 family DNA or RNA helicase